MFDVSSVAIEDFDYPLPEEKIAKYPLLQRDKAKLLCFGENGLPKDHLFCELPELLSKDTLLILNDTKVVYARLFFQRKRLDNRDFLPRTHRALRNAACLCPKA